MRKKPPFPFFLRCSVLGLALFRDLGGRDTVTALSLIRVSKPSVTMPRV